MDTLYRSLRALPFRRGPRRWIGGIAGGIAAKFGWDPTIVRIVMLLSFLLPVVGPAAYVVAWILLPWQDNTIPLERVLPGTQRPL